MPEDILTPLLLVGAGLVAGTINSIAGGGSLLTLPLLIFIGLPPTVANATNRIAIVVGGIGATSSFHKRDLIPFAWVKFGLPPALVGVALGTWGAMKIGDVAFERILAGILVAAAAWMIWRPDPPLAGDNPLEPDPSKRWLLRGAFFVLGLYSGFIQAGIGFLFLALLAANGLDLVRANAVKVPLILAFTILAVVLFAFAGMLDWQAGLMLAAGQFFGAKLGVHLQVLKGQAWVRNVLTVAIVVFALRLVLSG
ncbi:MAG: sulfite exporter TauE/SafE family protein [Gemmatimonadota bacterium]|nr:sulfite exporter TauE/SafE family protein [Gemmatimonadota bacterium]